MAAEAIPGTSQGFKEPYRITRTQEPNRRPTIREVLLQIQNHEYKSFEHRVSLLIVLWTCLAGKSYFLNVQDVFQFIYRESAKTIFSTLWSRVGNQYKRGLARAILQCSHTLGTEVENSNSLCSALLLTIYDPWGDPAIQHILNEEQVKEDFVSDFLETEPTDLLLIRIECLVNSGLEACALTLCHCCLKSKKLERKILSQQQHDPMAAYINWKLPFLEWLLRILYRKRKLNDLVSESSCCNCHDGVRLIRKIQTCSDQESKALAESLINIFLVRDLLFQSTYCCSKELMSLWSELQVKKKLSLQDVQEAARKLIVGHASNSAHFYIFVDTLWEQYGMSLIPLYLDLFIRGLTTDLNFLETARQASDKESVIEIENHIAVVYFKLATLFNEVNKEITLECMLSSFSLDPTQEKVDIIKKLALQISMEKSRMKSSVAKRSKVSKGHDSKTGPNSTCSGKSTVSTCDIGVQVGESPCLGNIHRAHKVLAPTNLESNRTINPHITSEYKRSINELSQNFQAHLNNIDIIVKDIVSNCIDQVILVEQGKSIILTRHEFRDHNNVYMYKLNNQNLSDVKFTLFNLLEKVCECVSYTAIANQISDVSVMDIEENQDVKVLEKSKSVDSIDDIMNELIDRSIRISLSKIHKDEVNSELCIQNYIHHKNVNLENENKSNILNGMIEKDNLFTMMNSNECSNNHSIYVTKSIKNCDKNIDNDSIIPANKNHLPNGDTNDESLESLHHDLLKYANDEKMSSHILEIYKQKSFMRHKNEIKFRTLNSFNKISNHDSVVNGDDDKNKFCNDKLHKIYTEPPQLDIEGKETTLTMLSHKLDNKTNDLNHRDTAKEHAGKIGGDTHVHCHQNKIENGYGITIFESSKSSGQKEEDCDCSINNVKPIDSAAKPIPVAHLEISSVNKKMCESRQSKLTSNTVLRKVWNRSRSYPFHHVIMDAKIPGVSFKILSDLAVVIESQRCLNVDSTCNWNVIKEACRHYLESIPQLRCKLFDYEPNESLDSEDSMSEIMPGGYRKLATFDSDGSVHNDAYVDKAPIMKRYLENGIAEGQRFKSFVNLSDIHHPYLNLDRILCYDASSYHRGHGKHHKRHRNKDKDPKKCLLKHLHHGNHHTHDVTKRKRKKRKKDKKEKSHNKRHHSTHKGDVVLSKKKRQRLKKKKDSPDDLGEYYSDFSSTELMRIVNEHSNSFTHAGHNAHGKVHSASSGESDLFNAIPPKKKRKQVSFKKVKEKKNALVKSHEKHKHGKTKSDKHEKKKDISQLKAIKDFSHIVQYSSVKEMQSVQIRRSSVSVDLANVGENSKTNSSEVNEDKQMKLSTDPAVKSCSEHDLMNLKLLLAKKSTPEVNKKESPFEENVVYSSTSNKKTFLKYVSSKTTSRLLSMSQTNVDASSSDTKANDDQPQDLSVSLPSRKKYTIDKPIYSTPVNVSSTAIPLYSCSSVDTVAVPSSAMPIITYTQANNIPTSTALNLPHITALTFPMSQVRDNISNRLMTRKFVIPLGPCGTPSVAQANIQDSNPTVNTIATTGNQVYYSSAASPNIIIVKKTDGPQFTYSQPMRNVYPLNKPRLSSSISQVPVVSRKPPKFIRSVNPTAVKVVKKYIHSVPRKPVITSTVNAMKVNDAKSVIRPLRDTKTIIPVSKVKTIIPIPLPLPSTFSKNETQCATSIAESVISKATEVIVAPPSKAESPCLQEIKDGIAADVSTAEPEKPVSTPESTKGENHADEDIEPESNDAKLHDIPTEDQHDIVCHSPITVTRILTTPTSDTNNAETSKVAQISQMVKNAFEIEESAEQLDEVIQEDAEPSSESDDLKCAEQIKKLSEETGLEIELAQESSGSNEDIEEPVSSPSESEMVPTEGTTNVVASTSDSAVSPAEATEENIVNDILKISTVMSARRANAASNTQRSQTVEKLQPLTIGVIAGVRPQGVVITSTGKVEGAAHSDAPTRSFTSISDAVRFSLMDMDDATGSVENQVLQSFQAFSQEADGYQVTSNSSEAEIPSLNTASNLLVSQATTRAFQEASVRTTQSDNFSECQITASATSDWNAADSAELVSPTSTVKIMDTSGEMDSSGEMKDEERIKKKKKTKEKGDRNPDSIKKFWCEICHRGFFSAYNLRRHCRNVHKMDLPKGSTDVPFTSPNSQCLAQVGGRVICSTVADSEAQAVVQQLATTNNSDFLLQSPTHDAAKAKDLVAQTSPCAHTKPLQHTTPSPNFTLHSPPQPVSQAQTSVPVSPVVTPPKDLHLQNQTSLGQSPHATFMQTASQIAKPVPRFQLLPNAHGTSTQNHQLSTRVAEAHQVNVSVATQAAAQTPRMMQQTSTIQKSPEITPTSLVQSLPCQMQQIQQVAQCSISPSKKQDQRGNTLQMTQHEQALRQARHAAELQQVQRAMQQAKKSLTCQASKTETLQQAPVQVQPTSTISHIQAPVLNQQMQKLVQIRQAALCGTPEFALQLSTQPGTADLHATQMKTPIQYFQAQVPSTQHPSILHPAVRQTLVSCAAARQNQAATSYVTQQVPTVSGAEFLSRVLPHTGQERSSCSQAFPTMNAADLCLVGSQVHVPIIRQSAETNERLEDLEQFLLENMPWSSEQIAATQGLLQHRAGTDGAGLPLAGKSGTTIPQQQKNIALMRAKQAITKPKPYKPPVITPVSKNLSGSKGSSVKKKPVIKKVPDTVTSIACVNKTGLVSSVTTTEASTMKSVTHAEDKNLLSHCSVEKTSIPATGGLSVSCSLAENDSHSSDSVQCIEITQTSKSQPTTSCATSTFSCLPQQHQVAAVCTAAGFYHVAKKSEPGIQCIANQISLNPKTCGNRTIHGLVVGSQQPLCSIPTGSESQSTMLPIGKVAFLNAEQQGISHIPDASALIKSPEKVTACLSAQNIAVKTTSCINNQNIIKTTSCSTSQNSVVKTSSCTMPVKPFLDPSQNNDNDLSSAPKEWNSVNTVIPIFDPNPIQSDNLDAEKEFNNLQSKISDWENHLKNSENKAEPKQEISKSQVESINTGKMPDSKINTKEYKDTRSNTENRSSVSHVPDSYTEKMEEPPKSISVIESNTNQKLVDEKSKVIGCATVRNTDKRCEKVATSRTIDFLGATDANTLDSKVKFIEQQMKDMKQKQLKICNPFLYSDSHMADVVSTTTVSKDAEDHIQSNRCIQSIHSGGIQSSRTLYAEVPSVKESQPFSRGVGFINSGVGKQDKPESQAASTHDTVPAENSDNSSLLPRHEPVKSDACSIMKPTLAHQSDYAHVIKTSQELQTTLYPPPLQSALKCNRVTGTTTIGSYYPHACTFQYKTAPLSIPVTSEGTIKYCTDLRTEKNMEKSGDASEMYSKPENSTTESCITHVDTAHSDQLAADYKQNETERQGQPVLAGRAGLRDMPKTSVKRSCPCCTDICTPKKCRSNTSTSNMTVITKILKPSTSKPKTVVPYKDNSKTSNGPSAANLKTRTSYRLKTKNGSIT